MKHWLTQIVISIDQLFNSIVGGWADETLSARAARKELAEDYGWSLIRISIDIIFFWQDEHCLAAFENEKQHNHMPKEYRHGGR